MATYCTVQALSNAPLQLERDTGVTLLIQRWGHNQWNLYTWQAIITILKDREK